MYKMFYDPAPIPLEKKSTPPPQIYDKNVCDPPNSQYFSPQTQSFIFAININIATTYLKIVCPLWIAMFLRVISWAWWQSDKDNAVY